MAKHVTVIKLTLFATLLTLSDTGPTRQIDTICYWSDEAASTAADDDLIRVETCADLCGPNRSEEATSTAADNDLIKVETCTDPCGPNRSNEAASNVADDDLLFVFY